MEKERTILPIERISPTQRMKHMIQMLPADNGDVFFFERKSTVKVRGISVRGTIFFKNEKGVTIPFIVSKSFYHAFKAKRGECFMREQTAVNQQNRSLVLFANTYKPISKATFCCGCEPQPCACCTTQKYTKR